MGRPFWGAGALAVRSGEVSLPPAREVPPPPAKPCRSFGPCGGHSRSNVAFDSGDGDVLGPDVFLGSGHPDVQEVREKNLPPHLGLIESRDAAVEDGGLTWVIRSTA